MLEFSTQFQYLPQVMIVSVEKLPYLRSILEIQKILRLTKISTRLHVNKTWKVFQAEIFYA